MRKKPKSKKRAPKIRRRRILYPDLVITVELYNDAQISVFTDFDRCNEWCKQNKLAPLSEDFTKESCGAAAMSEEIDGARWFVAYIPRTADVSTMAHESLHLAFDILKSHGVKVKHNNHESLAYLLTYIHREMVKRCRKK